MTITIHRGINQIGGCITEIASASGAKILIDLGHNLPEGDKRNNDPLDKPENIDPILEGVDAVFYTHSHGDHVGFEAKVADKNVPQYIGAMAKEVMIMQREHMARVAELKVQSEESLNAIRKFMTYIANDPISIGDITIRPYKISHSASDAYMFLIDCDGRRVLHTGDFRTHGYLGNRLEWVLNAFIHNVDILITEGTMISRSNELMRTEKELMEEAVEIMKQYDNVFVLCGSQDADRLASFNIASHRLHRPLVMDSYQMRIVRIFERYLGKYSYYHYGQKMDYYKNTDDVYRHLSEGGITMLVRASDSFKDNIEKMKPMLDPQRTCLIYSMFKGYIDEKSNCKSQNTYDFVYGGPWQVRKLHTSGHASREALEMVCKRVHPNLAIIPIHRDAESDFCSLDLPKELKDKVHTESSTIEDVKIIIK
jgi:ribonuclease J